MIPVNEFEAVLNAVNANRRSRCSADVWAKACEHGFNDRQGDTRIGDVEVRFEKRNGHWKVAAEADPRSRVLSIPPCAHHGPDVTRPEERPCRVLSEAEPSPEPSAALSAWHADRVQEQREFRSDAPLKFRPSEVWRQYRGHSHPCARKQTVERRRAYLTDVDV